MIDYKTLHPAVQAIVELALTSDTQAIAASGSPRFRELADKACDLFEQYSMEDQVGVCALMLGMIWATMEREHTDFEVENVMILAMKDRRAIFDAIAEAVYTESLQFASHQDCPTTQRRMM